MTTGCVYLVGAGPGDPDLLTVRAVELLGRAEVVAHDELVPPAIVDLAAPGAERLAVGRRRGRGAVPYRCHPAVIERARAGRVVVRLKTGDPFVFGRGGEELDELVRAGIPVEVVPGVTAALGAAAAAGIPLTERGVASSVTFATGHEGALAAADAGTLVLYMAAHTIHGCLSALVAAGRAPSTPAAFIAAATTAQQRTITGTLADLASRVGDPGADPALVIVGEVVGLRPLAGRSVLVARARDGRSRLAAALRGLGADVVEAPVVAAGPVDADALAAALARTGADAPVVVACRIGAAAVAARPPDAPIVAIGNDAVRALGGVPHLAVSGACAAALAPLAPILRDRRAVVVTDDRGRPHLCDELRALGAAPEVAPVYRIGAALPAIGPVEAIALPSSSAARALLEPAASAPLRAVPMAAIGPATEAAARALGARRVVRAPDDSVPALVASVLELLGLGEARP